MYKGMLVVEDFFDHPLEVRKIALQCNYPVVDAPLTFPGRNSEQSFKPPQLDQVMSQLVGEPLRGAANPAIGHGRFRITLAGEPSRYLVHVDPNSLSWVGLIYLTLPEHCQGGTSFFRHKALDLDRAPTQEQLDGQGVASVAELLRRDGGDAEKWEKLMTLPMRFNRLVLYRPWMWHSAAEAFGRSLEDGRLVYLVFFEPGRSGRPPADG